MRLGFLTHTLYIPHYYFQKSNSSKASVNPFTTCDTAIIIRNREDTNCSRWCIFSHSNCEVIIDDVHTSADQLTHRSYFYIIYSYVPW